MMKHAFAHPELLVALAALPILGLVGAYARARRRRALLQVGGLVQGTVLAARRGGRAWRGWCLSLGLTCLVVGMAGPRWGRDWSQSAAPGRDLVVVLDESWSMFAEAPSRLERGRDALLDLADTLRHQGGHRVALVTFAGKARLACPLTLDLDHFREIVEEIDLKAPDPELLGGPHGTRIGAALERALEAHDGPNPEARDILLLSDGDDPARDGEWRVGANRARAERVAVHVIGFGDPDTAHPIGEGKRRRRYKGEEIRTRLEEGPLRDIARRTGGSYTAAGTRRIELGDLYLALAGRAQREDSGDALPVYRPRYPWFLGPALFLLALPLLVPDRRR
jgi:Ca-activated chloride channel family protein